MDSLIKRYDWHWARPGLDMKAITDDGQMPHRLDIEGRDPSSFDMPFVNRAKRARSR